MSVAAGPRRSGRGREECRRGRSANIQPALSAAVSPPIPAPTTMNSRRRSSTIAELDEHVGSAGVDPIDPEVQEVPHVLRVVDDPGEHRDPFEPLVARAPQQRRTHAIGAVLSTGRSGFSMPTTVPGFPRCSRSPPAFTSRLRGPWRTVPSTGSTEETDSRFLRGVSSEAAASDVSRVVSRAVRAVPSPASDRRAGLPSPQTSRRRGSSARRSGTRQPP